MDILVGFQFLQFMNAAEARLLVSALLCSKFLEVELWATGSAQLKCTVCCHKAFWKAHMLLQCDQHALPVSHMHPLNI